jgi:uncharacterized protein YjiS (DUF1127 family)
MAANYPVLPIAGATLARASIGLAALMARWANAVTRALRHRRDAHVLAGLDRHMLADIGITRSDVRDAFSAPLWEDPTALLRERALERRLNRPAPASRKLRAVEPGFHRPPTDRPARQAV